MARPGSVTIKITGAKEFRRKLRRFDAELTGKGMKRTHLAAGDLVARRAKAIAPRRSGRLAGDIRVKATTTKADVVVGRASIPYAGPIHFGWNRSPQPDRGIWGGPIRANPFLFKAIESEAEPVIAAYEDGLNDILRSLGLI